MKIISIILTFVTVVFVMSKSNRQVYVEEANWKFEMPRNLLFSDSFFNSKEQLLPTKLGQRLAVTLFTIRVPSKGSLAAYIWKDSLDDQTWIKYHNNEAQAYFNDIRENGETVLETNQSTEKVGNGDFYFLHVKELKKNTSDTVSIYRYYKKQRDKVLHIIFEYSDSTVGSTFKRIISSSTFLD